MPSVDVASLFDLLPFLYRDKDNIKGVSQEVLETSVLANHLASFFFFF